MTEEGVKRAVAALMQNDLKPYVVTPELIAVRVDGRDEKRICDAM